MGSLPFLLSIHSPTRPGLPPPPRKRERNPEAPHQRQKERGRREQERLGQMRKEKKPETLSNSRDKRTVGQQTKWPAEMAREGLVRPRVGTRRTEAAGAGRGRPAGRGGGSPAAPGPLSRPLGAPHFTPRRPRPRLCGAGNTPAAQTAPAPSLPPPRFPAAARPPRRLEDPPRGPAPSCARVPTAGGAGEGAPTPGARRGGPGACRWGCEAQAARGSHRQGPGAMRTSGHLARTPARRRGIARGEVRRGRGGPGVRRLRGRAGGPFPRIWRKGRPGGGRAGW